MLIGGDVVTEEDAIDELSSRELLVLVTGFPIDFSSTSRLSVSTPFAPSFRSNKPLALSLEITEFASCRVVNGSAGDDFTMKGDCKAKDESDDVCEPVKMGASFFFSSKDEPESESVFILESWSASA